VHEKNPICALKIKFPESRKTKIRFYPNRVYLRSDISLSKRYFRYYPKPFSEVCTLERCSSSLSNLELFWSTHKRQSVRLFPERLTVTSYSLPPVTLRPRCSVKISRRETCRNNELEIRTRTVRREKITVRLFNRARRRFEYSHRAILFYANRRRVSSVYFSTASSVPRDPRAVFFSRVHFVSPAAAGKRRQTAAPFIMKISLRSFRRTFTAIKKHLLPPPCFRKPPPRNRTRRIFILRNLIVSETFRKRCASSTTPRPK